jgi:hypothetical protein
MSTSAKAKMATLHSTPNAPLTSKSRHIAHLLQNVHEGTKAYVLCSFDEPNSAPIFVPFPLVETVEEFFRFIMEGCDVPESSKTARYAAISFRWTDYRLRIRRGHEADWKELLDELVQAQSCGASKRAEGPFGTATRLSFKIDVLVYFG